MSDIIHLLPDSVANQIAAGEVIQRPASLIKELMENSIDAGATRIQVIVTDAGKSRVQVVDNGKGMSETDARLSFERHATSKISKAEDLFSLSTMGFRGEALASIAAVAQVELRTRMAHEELGVSIQIEGSKFIRQEPIACPVGANFIIDNLFFNIPARRKFLKSNHTELSNIIGEFERIALAHPELSFSLSTPDSVMFDLPPGNFRQRIVSIFGHKLDKKLIPVQVDTSVVSIAGFVGTTESSKKKGAQQYFFVNGRYMRHPFFAKAVQTSYERLIADGEQVPYFLQLIVDPAKIDVNIHPTKTEIKFEDEQAIWQILRAAVREALGKHNAIPTIDFDTENMPDIPAFKGNLSHVAAPEITIDPHFNPFDDSPASSLGKSSTASSTDQRNSPHRHTPPQGWEEVFSEALTSVAVPSDSSTASPFFSTETEQPLLYENLAQTEQQTWEKATAHYLQHKGRYLISPTETGLLIIDQHRAHLRILFEEYVEKISRRQQLSQRLLFPQIIELSAAQTSLLKILEEELENCGFEISFLGGGSFSILSVPTGVDGIDPTTLLQSILDDVEDKTTEVREDIVRSIALSLARKAALPVGQALSEEEMRDLAVRLFACQSPSFTPNGNAVFTLLPDAAFLKHFT